MQHNHEKILIFFSLHENRLEQLMKSDESLAVVVVVAVARSDDVVELQLQLTQKSATSGGNSSVALGARHARHCRRRR